MQLRGESMLTGELVRLRQAGEVVAGLGDAVGGAEQSGHQGTKTPVGDAGDGAQGDRQRAGQGLDPRVAESHG
jgi:hypothetical protein